MKNLIAALAIVVGSVFGASAQGTPVATGQGGPQISIDKDVHDYGTMEKGGDPYCEFVITNTGDAPLIISNAKGSCGCTVPKWDREPIMPGKTSTMQVRYDTKRVGPINKSVTITSNATNEPTKVIRIKGLIKAAPADNTAPLNNNTSGPVDNN